MKTYTEIAKEETVKFMKMDFADKPVGFDEHVAKIYAQQVGEGVRNKCVENINKLLHQRGQYINTESIKDTKIILP